MGKQWSVEEKDLTYETTLEKLYNEQKFQELNEILDEVRAEFPNNTTVDTAVRTIVEETMNIINYSSDWKAGELKVRSDFSSGTINLEIIYSGSTYWDPVEKKTTTVIGSTDSFESYKREVEISSGIVHITIKIKLRDQK